VVTIADVIADAVLEQAYRWLRKRRLHWPEEKERLRADLMDNTYTVGLLTGWHAKTAWRLS
jgi:hypothetical protein